MTPGELRRLIRHGENPIYKMSLGDGGCYRDEAFRENVLVLQSELKFYRAVAAKDEGAIMRTGRKVRSDEYPQGNAPDAAIRQWRRNIETFQDLKPNTIIIHWDSERKCLRWCIAGEGENEEIRTERNGRGQEGIVFHRPLSNPWKRDSILGIPLANLHRKAIDLAVNRGTISRVRTDEGYFRSLIADDDTSEWEAKPEWVKAAGSRVRSSASRAMGISARRQELAKPLDIEVLNWWDGEVRRMADTATHTAAYANGQTVTTIVKEKDMGFATKEELLEEIHHLIETQRRQCALTGHVFKVNDENPFLRPSLDRINSAKGYIPGNLQVATRAANFFKSASDEAEWNLKAQAIHKMALGMQRRRREAAAAASETD